MKSFLMLLSGMLICLLAGGAAFGQQSCEFSIIGTWQVATPDGAEIRAYRFTPDRTVTVLSVSGSGPTAKLRPIGKGTYELDDARTPKSISFKGGMFARSPYSMKVVKYDDQTFTCVRLGSAPVRWIRIDPNRYFIVLAARNGEFYDGSGSAFPVLIKVVGKESEFEAVGTYSLKGQRAFGPVPEEAYRDFLREPRDASEVMLRLEINSAQYDRGREVLRTWERRVREDALLYPTSYSLNNVLLVKAVTETLTQCSEEIKLYKLNYLHPEDWIAEQNSPAFIPFAYFKELRRLNESRHVRADQLQEIPLSSTPSPRGR